MDEIGRGTSTFDGLSLAWACAEQLAEKIQAYTLFATHYFELTRLPETIPELVNVHLDAVEHGDSIAFLHALQEGAANKSYGLQVAALAGVPKSVLDNAKTKLQQLEASSIQAQGTTPSQDLEQSTVPSNPQGSLDFTSIEEHKAVTLLASLDPDDLTPKQALAALYQLKEQL